MFGAQVGRNVGRDLERRFVELLELTFLFQQCAAVGALRGEVPRRLAGGDLGDGIFGLHHGLDPGLALGCAGVCAVADSIDDPRGRARRDADGAFGGADQREGMALLPQLPGGQRQGGGGEEAEEGQGVAAGPVSPPMSLPRSLPWSGSA